MIFIFFGLFPDLQILRKETLHFLICALTHFFMLVMAAKETDVCHENGLAAVRRVDLEKVKKMIYIHKCLDAYIYIYI